MSFWMSVLPPVPPRAPLPGDLDVDVAIVGAGYTGLWTAYYLARPTRRCGSRCSRRRSRVSAPPAATAAGARRCSRESVPALARTHGPRRRASRCTARWSPQWTRSGGSRRPRASTATSPRAGRSSSRGAGRSWSGPRHEVAEARGGASASDLRLLDAGRGAERGRRDRRARRRPTRRTARRSIRPGWCAAWPTRSSGAGVTHLRADPRSPRSAPAASTLHTGTVRADVVVRATEGYTPRCPAMRRTLAPVYSLMIATEPLPATFWAEVGLARAGDVHRRPAPHHLRAAHRRRPARVRRAGRAVPLRLGGPRRLRPRPARCSPSCAGCSSRAVPGARRRRAITHAWGGPLGIAAGLVRSVGLDRTTGPGVGGRLRRRRGRHDEPRRAYAGRPDPRARHRRSPRLPWVGHRSPPWEPEPLRWLGMNASLRVMTGADASESRTGRPSRRAALMSRVLGG